MKNNSWLGNLLASLVIPVLVLLVWLLATSVGGVNQIILPSPAKVLSRLFSLIASGDMLGDVGWTLLRTVLGFVSGAVAGVLLGTAMGSWRRIHSMTVFPVDFLRSLPATTIFPLFMLVLGLGLKSMVALIAFPCCWLVTINTMYGVRNSSLIRREMAEVFRLSRTRRFFFVTLPDAMPSIAASLRLSVAISLHMAIIGEMFMGSTIGIGRRVFDAHMLLRVSEMYSIIIIAGTLGYVLNRVFVAFEKKLVFWGGR